MSLLSGGSLSVGLPITCLILVFLLTDMFLMRLLAGASPSVGFPTTCLSLSLPAEGLFLNRTTFWGGPGLVPPLKFQIGYNHLHRLKIQL